MIKQEVIIMKKYLSPEACVLDLITKDFITLSLTSAENDDELVQYSYKDLSF